jgi:hypothetical protein
MKPLDFLMNKQALTFTDIQSLKGSLLGAGLGIATTKAYDHPENMIPNVFMGALTGGLSGRIGMPSLSSPLPMRFAQGVPLGYLGSIATEQDPLAGMLAGGLGGIGGPVVMSRLKEYASKYQPFIQDKWDDAAETARAYYYGGAARRAAASAEATHRANWVPPMLGSGV